VAAHRADAEARAAHEAERAEADRLAEEAAAAEERASAARTAAAELTRTAADQFLAAPALLEPEATVILEPIYYGPSDEDLASRAIMANLLTELNRASFDDPAPPPVVVPVITAQPLPTRPVDDVPPPMVERDMADTAMLLRELSSLGFATDDDRSAASPPPSQAAPPRQAPRSIDPKKKKKGLFGRG
jgi:hypothetical protein